MYFMESLQTANLLVLNAFIKIIKGIVLQWLTALTKVNISTQKSLSYNTTSANKAGMGQGSF